MTTHIHPDKVPRPPQVCLAFARKMRSGHATCKRRVRFQLDKHIPATSWL